MGTSVEKMNNQLPENTDTLESWISCIDNLAQNMKGKGGSKTAIKNDRAAFMEYLMGRYPRSDVRRSGVHEAAVEELKEKYDSIPLPENRMFHN